MFALSPFRLRPFRDADAARCARLLEDGWRDALPNRAREIDTATFDDLTRGEQLIVATQGVSGVIGFIAVDCAADFIHHLYVDRARRGRGIGAALLAQGLALTRGRASLKCALSNLAALEFYHHLGWTWGERGFDVDGPWVRLWAP